MRTRTLVFVVFVSVSVGMPLVGRAALPDPFFYDTRLIGMPNIYYGKPQTAVRVGNAPTLQTSVYTQGITPFVSVDLSQLGFSSTTTSGTFRGYGAPYYPSYFYNFGPIQITSDIHDGTYIVPLTAIGTYGVATTTMSIIVDNVLPTVSLSDITFSTTSPQKGDYMYLSGSANGTGSALRVYEVMEGLFDVNGNPLPGNYHGDIIGYDTQPIVSALASSTDGTFIKVPIQLFEYDMGQIARAVSFRIRIGVYDEAGNTASTSLIVPIQKPPPPDPCATPGACSSNVLFLPGIEGSRLYEGTGCGKTAEEKLWDPVADSNLKIIRGAGDDKVKRLFLDSTGESVCSDIYTKTDGVIDSVRGNNIYKSFIDGMNELETNGTINDWKPVAYDWRLSLDDILNSGNQLPDGRIYYSGDLAATSSPYLIQELRRLAKDSKTGKVTIVAHSNGGLVAKALLNRLGGETATTLVEKVILVGAPQSGAPVAVGALLYGLDQGISSWGISVLHADVARELAQNSPMAYHLLPSEDYLESVTPDLKHPVASFAGDAYRSEISAYGSTISNRVELKDFLLASSLNSGLIDYGNNQHATLDFWTPPAGIEVSQVAGWGADTIAGIDFYTSSILSSRKYRPIFTEDGDGTVPIPSALMMATSTSVKRYWVDTIEYFKATKIRRTHRDLFEIPSLEDFIKNIIKNSTSTLPAYISTSQPPTETENKKLTFFLHSPLTLQLKDASGNITGLAEDGTITGDITGATYGEFGDVKYIIAQDGGSYELILHGQDTGTFSLDIQESSGSVVTASSTIANVPTTPNTIVSLTLSGGISTASALTVDIDGDGKNVLTLTPKVGETVSYEPPAPAPAPQIISAGRGNRGASISEPVIVATTTHSIDSGQASSTATTTNPTATSTPVIAISTKPAKEKKKSPAPAVAIVQKENKNIPQTPLEIRFLTGQTASVYSASQQPVFARLGRSVYNGLHGFWLALKKFF